MDWETFMNPFMGLGTTSSILQAPGLMSPGLMQDLPGGFQTPPPPDWSTEGMIGQNVNPQAAGSPDKTNDPTKAAAASDTDVSAAAQKKAKGLTDVLKGLKAPAAPTPQTIRSPAAPQMTAQKSQLATLLASMGITPREMLRLGQSFGR